VVSYYTKLHGLACVFFPSPKSQSPPPPESC
jgi:hypothetical protein